jgi:hypothetical protein
MPPQQLPPPVEPDLPPLNEFDAPMMPGEDPVFADSLYGGVPGAVAQDVAQAPLPETGVGFDFNSLNVQTREDFDALPSEQQELLKAMKRGVQFTPESAAQFITSQMTRRMEAESRMQVRQSDPVVKRSVEKLDQDMEERKRLATQKRQAVLDEISSMRGTIGSLLTHPGFSGSVGMKNSAYGFGLPIVGSSTEPYAGTPEADFKAMLDQVQGAAFLQAFERLKGGGQITQIEGEKATQAIIRAQQSQSEDGFKKSMQEALELLNRAEKRVTSGESVQQPSAPVDAPASAQPQAAAPPKYVVGQSYTDGKGQTGIFDGYNRDGTPKFSRPSR